MNFLEWLLPRNPDTCKRKVRYGRLVKALTALEEMGAKGVKGLEVYPCKFCEGYHLGHRIEPTITITKVSGK